MNQVALFLDGNSACNISVYLISVYLIEMLNIFYIILFSEKFYCIECESSTI